MRPERAFLLFHLRTGTRLSLRLLAPLLAAVFIAYYLFRPEFIIQVSMILFRESGLLGAGPAVTLALIAVSKVAERRVGPGFRGWIRHLPSKGRRLRRTAVLSVFLAEVPTIAVLGGLGIFVTRDEPGRALAVAAGLLVAGMAAASFAVTSRKRPVSKAFSLAACLVGPSGRLALTAAGAGFLFLSDLTGGSVGLQTRRRRKKRSPGDLDLETLLTWRAGGWRILPAFLLASPALAAALLFIHNSRLTGRDEAAVSSAGAVLFSSVFLGLIAGIIEKRRPVWAWARSLPRSSGHRVLRDAGFFFICGFLGILGLVRAPGRPFLAAAAVLPFLCMRAAAGLRGGTTSRWGVPGVMAGEGFLIAMSVALIRFSPWFFLAMTLPAFLAARAREKRLKPGRWDEMRHMSAGDPLSWSAL